MPGVDYRRSHRRYPEPLPLFLPSVRRLLVLACILPAAVASQPAPASEASLERTLTSAMSAAGPYSGAWVRNATEGRTFFRWRSTVPRVLASNVKIFTTSAALDRFGPAGTLQTRVAAEVPPDAQGVLRGDLYLRGGGDPAFGSDSFVRRSYGSGATVEQLAAAVQAAGVRQVTGRVIGDESRFDSLRGGPDSGYGTSIWVGPLSALGFNRGLARESGSAFQANPPAFAAARLDSALSQAGVSVAGTPRAGQAPDDANTVASVDSPSMARLVEITNTHSDNYFAEMLLKNLGREAAGSGTTSAGARAARSFARRMGARPRLVDGSGLARANTASPRHVGTMLNRLRTEPEFDVLYRSLPVAGETGTLADRMRRGAARGRCRAKTGTISGVSVLSGYCGSRGGDTYVFSFLMNGVNVYGARRLQDRMANALARER
jgi:D-alanyl-D-alanine carboxypeptidase/D-alanyl-D-alanine-endopeptidase (penicillin-binding protein 4)